MLVKHTVEGFEAFKAKAEELAKEDKPLFVYFSGSKASNGKPKLSSPLLKTPLYLSLSEI